MMPSLEWLVHFFTVVSPFIAGFIIGYIRFGWRRKIEMIILGVMVGVALASVGLIGMLLLVGWSFSLSDLLGILIFEALFAGVGTFIGANFSKKDSTSSDSDVESKTLEKSEPPAEAEKISEIDEGLKIGLGVVLWFGVSLLLIVAGIGNLPRNFPGGILIFLGGLIIFPPFNKLLENKLNIALTSSLKILGVVVLVGIGGTIVGQSVNDTNSKYQFTTSTPTSSSKDLTDEEWLEKQNITLVSEEELQDRLRNISKETTEQDSKNPYDLGEFYVVVHPPENEKYSDYIPRANGGGIEYVLTGDLYLFNTILALPIEEGVPVNLAECGTANAFYNPVDKYIVFCYEMVELLDNMGIAKYGESYLDSIKIGPLSIVWDNVEFILYHELAHALIDIYDLPITGREEDAADQLATVVMADNCRLGFCADLSGRLVYVAEQWKMQAQIRKMQGYDPNYWDVHAIDEQRYANILCWTYGSDPEKFESMVETGKLPVSRARTCQDEFEQMRSSWGKLLEPYFTGERPTIEGRREAVEGT